MTDNDGYIGCIYKLVNLINGKVYIGQTRQTLNKRRNSHFRNTCNKHLRSALNKYGKQNFTILTLESIYEKDVYYNLFDDILNIKERYWINYYNSLNPLFGYNKSIRTSLYEDSKKKKQQYKKRIKKEEYFVDVVCPKTFTVLQTYKSVTEAGKAYNTYPSSITLTCNLKQLYCKGLCFKKTNTPIDVWKRKFDSIKLKRGLRTKYSSIRISSTSKPVSQYSLSGEFIKMWFNIKEIATFYNISETSVKQNINGKYKSCNGFVFRIAED